MNWGSSVSIVTRQ